MPRERRLIVVGSGAAGLACALAACRAGLNVTVLEAGRRLGGTTAISGGAVWVPANRWARVRGIADSPEAATEYLHALSLGDYDETLAEAYVRKSVGALAGIEDSTPLRWEMQPGWPDYHAELAGGRKEGRSLEIGPALVGVSALEQVRSDPYDAAPITVNEERLANPPDDVEIRSRKQSGVAARGRGLIAGLYAAVRELGGQIRTDVRATAIAASGEAVVGVIANGDRLDGRVAVTTGGFERDAQLVRHFLRGPMTAPGGVPTNKGDGLRMGMSVGAAIGNMSEAWWCASLAVEGERIENDQFFRMLFLDLATPGGIVVDNTGRRFADEASNYNDFGRMLHELDPNRYRFTRVPSWLIFDSRRRSRQLGPLAGKDTDPSWLVREATLDGLAQRIGVQVDALRDTLDRFNDQVAEGVDTDFGRGSTAFDRFSAGTTRLASIDEPPFYAMRVLPGCLGTRGGLRIDEYGRVINVDGDTIEGLYAAGNATASPFGLAYPGGGATIGPALTFGWVAGESAAS